MGLFGVQSCPRSIEIIVEPISTQPKRRTMVRMLTRIRLSEIGGLHPRRLIRGVCKSFAVPLLFAGVICAVVPFVYGAVDRTATPLTGAPSTITVPLLTQSTATGSVGHVRVINHAMSAGTVRPMAAGTPPASATPRQIPRASRSSTTGRRAM